ncbi:MAG: electron transfer flavoprotein subunit beta/FixA family protein [Planctomycetota bacterium]|nr:MAG: electron transfer flavoprotein subunit beta/FixA family protein [Planctomycetota bacterium]
MEFIACVKRVPSTTTRVAIAGDGKSLDPAGVEFELNPYDEFAVEEALRQRDAAGGGTVTVMSFGPGEAQKELRTEMAKGADAAVLLKHDGAGTCDGATTARLLAANIKDRSFDLLLFGKQAVDRDQHGVGPMVASILGVPCITEVIKLEIQDGKVTAEREVEGAHEVIETSLPCAITCQKGLNEPRFAPLKGIMAAKRKPLEILEVDPGEAAVEVLEMSLPPERPAGRIVGEGAAAVPELVQALREEAKVL